MGLEKGGYVKDSGDIKNASRIPVRVGLFEYPLADGKSPVLLANRCTQCGKTFFPKRVLCPYCFDTGEMEKITLERQGIIYACTVVHIPSPVGIKAPYAYGYVDIPANSIRLCTLFKGDDPFSFAPGQEVELVLEALRINEKGQQIIGYKFRAVS